MISSCCTSELTDEKLNKDRQTSASRRCPSCGHNFDSNPVHLLYSSAHEAFQIHNWMQQQLIFRFW
jgi:hypothetical protein